MEEIAESLNAFVDKTEGLDTLLRAHVQEAEVALEFKLAQEEFYPFKKNCEENLERINGFMREIHEMADGEQEAAFIKVWKSVG